LACGLKPQPGLRGVVEDADRQAGHGGLLAGNAVNAINASRKHRCRVTTAEAQSAGLPPTPLSTPQALQDFANWVATIRGDEASEAQTYVNRLR
jgi:hypothetical protein